jgi:hypothetical protein
MTRRSAAAAISNDSTPQQKQAVDDHWLQKQFEWENIEHLIKTGRILSLVYDTETTDLNPMFAALTQFSGKVVDLQGRIIDEVKLDIQVPEDVVISPQAALVTQSRPEALYRAEGRVPPHIAAAQIMLFFRNPYRKLWDQLADQAITVTSNSGKEEEVRVYTLTSPDGEKQATIRLHQGGKFLSYQYPEEERLPDGAQTYRDQDGTRWKRIASPAMTEGYNNKRFDDRVLWATLHRAMSDEIFLTHTKKYRRFRVDTMDLAKMVALLDEAGENGFKPGVGIDKTTGLPYKAFTLSSLMEANTRDAIPERGLDEGVRMPDGSKYDRQLAHANADYDVDATISLKAYLRKRAPDVLRTVEINSDFERIKPFLIGGEGFAPHPLRAFARSMHPHGAQLHFGVCVNINEEIEERRQAVMIRTDLDQPLEKYTFRGKKLLEMSVDELAVMLQSQRGQPDALCEVINLRKNPPVIPAEMAFHRGIGGDPEKHEANRRFVISHEEFGRKLMQAHSKSMPKISDHSTIRNPQAEEHLFTSIASPKRYEFEMDGQKVLLTETVHAEWVKALRRNRNIDAVLRRAIKPQVVEFEDREDTLHAFVERMRTVDGHLQKYFGTGDTGVSDGDHSDAAAHDHHEEHELPSIGQPAASPFKMLPAPDQNFIPPKWDYVVDPDNKSKRKRVPHVMSTEECRQLSANAREYLWKLRAELMYEFHDNTTRFTVQDKRGHDIDFATLNRMKQGDLANRLRTGEYKINMEELNWSSELIARMFRDAGRIEWVKKYMADQGRDEDVRAWEKWEEYFAAERALRFHGAPHEDPDQQRWMTASKSLKEIARIRDNLRKGDVRAQDDQWGGWDIYMRGGFMAERILDECDKLARRQLQENALTDERLHLLGYDPEKRGLPIEHTPYNVPEGAKILTLDVPDRMLEAPLSHHNVANNIIMLELEDAQQQALTEAGPDVYLFLRGAQSGRTFLAAKPALLSPDEISPGPYFQEVYAAAANRFADSGMTPPAPEKFLPIAVEALEPVPSKIDSTAQTIKIPRWEDFMATVSPTLGYRDEPLTGLVIKDYGFTPDVGIARLQGMVQDEGKPGQTESGWEVPTNVTRVRTLSLKDARDRINTGREQVKAAVALGLESVEDLREAIAGGSITETQAKDAGLKGLKQLEALMQEESFTPRDAIHYGYASLTDMRSKLTALFVDQELDTGRADNLIHFVDIDTADKAKMAWHCPARRAMVSLGEGVAGNGPQADPSWTRVVDRDSDQKRSR